MFELNNISIKNELCISVIHTLFLQTILSRRKQKLLTEETQKKQAILEKMLQDIDEEMILLKSKHQAENLQIQQKFTLEIAEKNQMVIILFLL